jgi:hypothetical protein
MKTDLYILVVVLIVVMVASVLVTMFAKPHTRLVNCAECSGLAAAYGAVVTLCLAVLIP